MATLGRVRITWSGTAVVGGGVSTFYTSNSDPSAFTTALHTFFAAIKGFFPPSVTIVFPSGGETIDSDTGEVNGVWSMTQAASVVGEGDPDYAAGVGLRVTWNTAGITRGRRVKGTTFLVPISSDYFDNNGNIDDAPLLSMNPLVAALIAADGGSMRIYSRPQVGASTGGVAHAVTSATVPDKVTWLRSRRT